MPSKEKLLVENISRSTMVFVFLSFLLLSTTIAHKKGLAPCRIANNNDKIAWMAVNVLKRHHLTIYRTVPLRLPVEHFAIFFKIYQLRANNVASILQVGWEAVSDTVDWMKIYTSPYHHRIIHLLGGLDHYVSKLTILQYMVLTDSNICHVSPRSGYCGVFQSYKQFNMQFWTTISMCRSSISTGKLQNSSQFIKSTIRQFSIFATQLVL